MNVSVFETVTGMNLVAISAEIINMTAPSVRIHVAPIELESMRGWRGMIHETPREGNWFNS